MSKVPDTFERSCEHWSEEGRDGMEHFYVLATEDYRQLARSTDWVSWLGERAAATRRPLRLLDVACGSAKFLTALKRHGGLDAADFAPIGDAHYIAFYRQYLKHINPDATPYSTAEQLGAAFAKMGAGVEMRDIVYDGTVAASETAAVEGYLQRCLFDDSMTLAQMREHPALGEYLDGCLDGDTWRFRQRAKLFFCRPSARKRGGLTRCS